MLHKTACYPLHIAANAKMVEFAGYAMPVQYERGIRREHLHTRSEAGLFDVSHMGQIMVSGESAIVALERLLPIDVDSLAINQQIYTVLTDESGGIRDDLIVTRRATDRFLLVVNAACKHQDLAYLQQQLVECDVIYQPDRALLAIQGPKAKTIIGSLAADVTRLSFMNGIDVQIDGVDCFVSRSGYTGEDGFEISLPNVHAEAIAKLLLRSEALTWVGLGARDSLRLESGLCLYGHDMNLDTTPIIAGLSWSIGASRKSGGAKQGGFPGAEVILAQLANGAETKRVGFLVDGKAPVREGAIITDAAGEEIGCVTSGTFSPSLNQPIAMGYLSTAYAALGTQVQALVRDKPRPMTVSKMPFVQQQYVRS